MVPGGDALRPSISSSGRPAVCHQNGARFSTASVDTNTVAEIPSSRSTGNATSALSAQPSSKVTANDASSGGAPPSSQSASASGRYRSRIQHNIRRKSETATSRLRMGRPAADSPSGRIR
jgi:hypothetical protein